MATLLNDDEKRWCVYGIALNHIFIPAVQPYLKKTISKEYHDLKESHNIHVQKIHNFPSPYDPHYKNINNNEKKDKENFDYKITSHVDFGKLFLQNYMAKFNSYDCCDASAVLNLLERFPISENLVQNAAKIVRENRNSWAHCKFNEWNETDFHQKIENMKQLVKQLSLGTEEKGVMNDLNYWKDQALTLWTNNRASREELKEHINSLSKEIEESKFEDEACKKLLRETLNKFSHFMKEILQIKRRVDEVEGKQKVTSERVDEVANEQSKTSERVDEVANEQSKTNERVDEVANEQSKTSERVDEVANEQSKTSERVDEVANEQSKTSERVDEVANEQSKTSERVDKVANEQSKTSERVDEVANEQSKTSERVDEVANEQSKTSERVDEVANEQSKTSERVDEVANEQSKTNKKVEKLEQIIQSMIENRQQITNTQTSIAINQPHPSTKHELQLQEWKYLGESTKHRNLLLKLCDHKDEIKLLGDVRVIFSREFCIGEGSNDTRVYLGLKKDGYGKAVKRILRENWIMYAHQEKKILNEFNVKNSKYVVKYSSFEEDTGTDYVYLILDLYEESLESFVNSSTLNDLQKVLPKILRQILQGLADLHSAPHPILHRDLKPSNILRDSHSDFMIADFGISRILEDDAKTFRNLANLGPEYWIAPESYNEGEDSVDKARYKKESDVYNAGMVAYYVATKGRHPFGNKVFRLSNMLAGNPVGLMEIKDETLKDLLSWMLSLKPEDRPSANEALKHPFLMSDDEKFDLLCKVGNQQPIKRNDPNSIAVQQLNSEFSDWKSQMDDDVYDYFRTNVRNEKILDYGSSWTECLRLIRYIGKHWNDRTQPRPQPELFYKIGDPKNYFLKTFPNLPVRVHAAVRSDNELKNNQELKNIFNFNLSKM
ncbi:probable serine/threonine-protein kinase ireA isoform X3 [Xenia sp. Carnegie-2017]|uniref:probable serine/threonine-protein kinase ireA isoform X3 n=1 Tax=Xenia sp. Carnegie-2017 TaxID=2897299 RepID=UPI001F03D2F6|nr:probable serine/threonine-protein kinase ireA isoform X3 [Xenia sp. Carnegie-2017]